MKVRYNYFFIIIGFLHLPYVSWATFTWPRKALLHNSIKAPSLLLDIPKIRFNNLSSTEVAKVGELELVPKTMGTEAIIQRAWISSMVVPGLGQVYNKHYWKVPCFYVGFSVVCYRVYLEYQEMNKHKRTLLLTDIDKKPNDAFTQKRIRECERTRNLFAIIAAAWYLLNIFDAYAGGHDQTVNFKNDIGSKSDPKSTTVIQPSTSMK